jgi:hypothetical protein
MAGSWQGNVRGIAWERHGMRELAFNTAWERHGMCESGLKGAWISSFIITHLAPHMAKFQTLNGYKDT